MNVNSTELCHPYWGRRKWSVHDREKTNAAGWVPAALLSRNGAGSGAERSFDTEQVQ
jgi:hypothetical protein